MAFTLRSSVETRPPLSIIRSAPSPRALNRVACDAPRYRPFFENAVGYVRSRPNVSEVKRLYVMRLRTRAHVVELERTACSVISPEVTIGSSLRDVSGRARCVITLETR